MLLIYGCFDMVNKKNNRSSFFCVFKYLIFILQHFLRWIFINSLSRGFYYSIKYSSTVTIGYGAKVTRISKFEGCNRVCAHSTFNGTLGYGSYIGFNSRISGEIGRFTSIADDCISRPKSEKVIDYKTKLQEYIQSDSRKTVHYETVNVSGPSNKPEFEVIVMLDDINLGRGKGFSKKRAEQMAAKDAFEKMVK